MSSLEVSINRVGDTHMALSSLGYGLRCPRYHRANLAFLLPGEGGFPPPQRLSPALDFLGSWELVL